MDIFEQARTEIERFKVNQQKAEEYTANLNSLLEHMKKEFVLLQNNNTKIEEIISGFSDKINLIEKIVSDTDEIKNIKSDTDEIKNIKKELKFLKIISLCFLIFNTIVLMIILFTK